MNKEIGIKIYQHPSGKIKIMKWVCDGKKMIGRDMPYTES
jgi:hypothetical protein